MTDRPDRPLVLPLADPAADLATVGGKGLSLARMARADLPVPDGFHVTTEAYRRATETRLGTEILAIVGGVRDDDPAGTEAASQRVAQLFADHGIPDEVAEAVRRAYRSLGEQTPVAVRSSATAEDLPELSFAGQQDTILDVRGTEAVLAAVGRCWASLWTARAIDYRRLHRVDGTDLALAVVVQRLVPADAAGVLFTANPISGERGEAVVNASWGLGESIVSGRVTPDSIVVRREGGTILDERISDKTVMTVRTDGHPEEVPVPAEQRRIPVLTPAEIRQLVALGARIESAQQMPVDVEWARHDGRFLILQARPITGLGTREPGEEIPNDSLGVYRLWTNGNLGEAIPDVMTPCTWSLVQIFMADGMATSTLPGFRAYGNIGGRFYMDLSQAVTLAGALGIDRRRFTELSGDVFGRLPSDLPIPPVPSSRAAILRRLIPVTARVLRRVFANQRRLAGFFEQAPRRCAALRSRIEAAEDNATLAALWRDHVEPFFHECNRMLEAATRLGGTRLVHTRGVLGKTLSAADRDILLTGFQTAADPLASLGPLLGLEQLANGALDRAEFAVRFGHRSAHEFEVSRPYPAEDPQWIDEQLAGLADSARDVTAMIEERQRARDEAWERFARRSPNRVDSMRRRLAKWAEVIRYRESARSEVIRAFALIRSFVLRAGAVTGHGDDLFFLTIQEILGLLEAGTGPAALTAVPARRRTYERYSSLPPYPALILGPFDPVRWASDPERRTDLFDARGRVTEAAATVTGFPGSAGTVEGIVRVIAAPADGAALQAGEILVTTVTNIGWTPLFPKAAAIVTDVGAPLSHASIVARELGIPSVVGCGNAMMRLHDGDRVRVDGARGTVEVLTGGTER
ncbi:PEP/pyruvate-binding domain-containing protein [Actinoalloteichus hymeniacidonis]|uniref:Pyruvate phosphate dikinase-like protein n=1 Tax=Actinoalloteichus hymeniacidonis TaxID=340345 RepID=A0AAC9MZG4_9PSEU|nr:PEP/pyruvate-binding domain-containing protein [Actinoalloteichus hymeniacidonis]AOS64439.1 pyruvate phosphate dikinase-like protein [Actinoalloteichus hymeniacidonis]MBB5907491.1 pyruvate,water dikinase [Actinoalloteichus hymeniacidonis]